MSDRLSDRLSDRWAVGWAVAAIIGALHPRGLPLLLGAVVVVIALALRRPAVLCVAVALLTSSLAQRSLDGLDGVVPGTVAADVTLLSDPRPSIDGVRADARLGRRRVELRADGVAAVALRQRLAGERVAVRGELSPVGDAAPWLVSRHVSGRLRVLAVESWRHGSAISQGANQLRRTLERGAASMPLEARSLYTGLVFGDDRSQPAALADDFLGAGLTHLLAVSGQNVAFVLALAGPLLRRLRLWPRLAATLGVIAMFGVVTRFEPSVLRASTMAALATTVATLGGPVSRLRVLTLAVTLLLVVDPLLVRSVGFQLSTAATAAIVLATPRLAAALPGPAALREALAVTLAAQLGVAPLLLAVFGPLPVASLPANLLAVPAAGAVMVWGLTGGVVAGLLDGRGSALLHVPTTVLLAWIAGVARRAAALPLGELRWMHATCLAIGLGVAAAANSVRDADGRARPVLRPVLRRGLRRGGLVLAALSMVTATISAQAPPPLRTELQTGVVRWHAGATDVVVLGGVGGRSDLRERTVLGSLRRAGVGSIDVLVLADATPSPALVAAIEARHPLGAVVRHAAADPPSTRVGVHPAPVTPTVVAVGALQLRVTPTGARLVVEAVPSAMAGGGVASSR